MAKRQATTTTADQRHARAPRRGALARPLDSLAFLLPLMVWYEIASLSFRDRVIAYDLLRGFVELFGSVGRFAPGLAVVAILLATHVVSKESWKINYRRVGLMYIEAIALAVPMLLMRTAFPLVAAATDAPTVMDRVAMGVGAGVYEELVFRLILVSILVIVGSDLMRLDRGGVAVGAVILTSLAFAVHHHEPFGSEPLALVPLVFRTMAGVYLAVIFWYRGYGPAAGCHAGYNVLVTLW